MWERLKMTERFSFVNRSQVLHVVADDLVSEDWRLYQWQAEIDQTLTGVQRLRALMNTWGWSEQEQEEVVFISGNVDEIMSRCSPVIPDMTLTEYPRSVLHQLRHCELQPGVLWGGLVTTTGDITRAMRVSQ